MRAKIAILTALLVGLSIAVDYVSEQNPTSDFKKMFAKVDFKKANDAERKFNVKIPSIMEDLEMSQVIGDPKKSAENFVQLLKNSAKSSSSSSSSQSASKKSSARSSTKTANSSASSPKKNAATSSSTKSAAKTSTKEQLLAKYIAEEKGDAKARAIQTTSSNATTVFECSHGECCDVKTGKYKTAGMTCYRTPCSGPSQCLGVSGECPPALTHKADGTSCPGGVRQMGVCVSSIYAPTASTLSAQSLTTQKSSSSSSSSAKVKSSTPVPTTFNVFDHKIKCTQGGCCNLKTGYVKVLGSTCETSKHECYEAVNYCNGYESKCPRKAVADGTPCSNGGQCMNGVCTAATRLSSSSSSSTSSAFSSTSTKSDTDGMSAVGKEQVSEYDVNLAQLESKIRRAKERQEKLKKAIRKHKQENNKRFIRAALDYTNKKVNEEYELARRAVYPYKTAVSHAEAIDNAGRDFSIHEYIAQMAKEQQRYDEQVMRQANAKLQSSNGKYRSFPWIACGVFVLAVVALCLIVGISKASKSSRKKKSVSSEEYEKF